MSEEGGARERGPNAAAALAAIAAGFAVFPTSADGKRPHGLVARKPGKTRGQFAEHVPDWLLHVYPESHAHAGELAGGFHQATADPDFAERRYWAGGCDHPPGIAVPPGACVIDVDSDRFPADLLKALCEASAQVVSTPSRGFHVWFRLPDGMPLQRGLFLDEEDPGRPGVRVHVGDWKPGGKGYCFPPGAQREGKQGPYTLLTKEPFTADPERLTAIPEDLLPRLAELYGRSRSTNLDLTGGCRRFNASATAKARKREKAAAAGEGREPREVAPVWRQMTTGEIVSALPDLAHGTGRRDVLLHLTSALARRGVLRDWTDRIRAAVAGWTSPENPAVQSDVDELLESASARFERRRAEDGAAVDPETGIPSADGSGPKRATTPEIAHAIAVREGFSAWITNPLFSPGSAFQLAVGLLHEYPKETLIALRESKTEEVEECSPLYVLSDVGIWRRSAEQAHRMMIDWASRVVPVMWEYSGRVMRDAKEKEDKVMQAAGGKVRSLAGRVRDSAVRTPGEKMMTEAGAAAGSRARMSLAGKDQRRIREVLRKRGVLHRRQGSLNADGRYMGARNGVVDLHTGGLLAPEAGRMKLITAQVPHDFKPFAEHAEDAREDVGRLTEYLRPADAEYTWNCLGFAMLGRPSKAFYLLFGRRDGAKTTLMMSLRAALGNEYSDDIHDSALDRSARTASSGLSPEQAVFASPRRFAFSDELKVQPNSKTLKDRSGGGTVTYRGMFGREMVTRPVTASMMISTNPQSMPRLDLQDDALMSRLRVIPCPSIPPEAVDREYVVRMQQPDRAACLFARLVEVAAGLKDRSQPPPMPPTVQAACLEVARLDRSDLDSLAACVVEGDAGDWLSIEALWDAWMSMHEGDEPDPQGRLAKYTRSALATAMGRKKGMGKSRRRGKDRERGWYGWRLEEDLVPDPDPDPESGPDRPEPPAPAPEDPEPAPAPERVHSGTSDPDAVSECDRTLGGCGVTFRTNGGRTDLCYVCRTAGDHA